MADAYVVVFAALMLPAGLLGDRFGRRRMLITGLGIFLAGALAGALVGALAGALAGDVNAVIAARAVMGVGGALVTPLALSVLPTLLAPGERAKAVGIVSAASALGLPLGPIIGGRLLNHFWWGSVFLVNVPMAALGIAACVFLLPETRDPSSPEVPCPPRSPSPASAPCSTRSSRHPPAAGATRWSSACSRRPSR